MKAPHNEENESVKLLESKVFKKPANSKTLIERYLILN